MRLYRRSRCGRRYERAVLPSGAILPGPTVYGTCWFCVNPRNSSHQYYLVCDTWEIPCASGQKGSLAERSKALASGASPKGREFESRSCHFSRFRRARVLLLRWNGERGKAEGPVAQWIRHRSTEPEIVGSSPTRIIFEIRSSTQARPYYPWRRVVKFFLTSGAPMV